MAIEYEDQGAAVRDTGLQNRVEAGVMIVALSVETLPPISGVGAQQRKDFTNKVISTSDVHQPTFGVHQFCWAIVGVKQLADIGQISDNQINNVITTNWDRIAQAMMPPTAGGP
jgi:hypothetical protein